MINESYFVREISLPNLDKKSDFDDTIAWYEKRILIKLLGYTLYKAFTDGLAEGSPAQKWLDLRDGKDFSFEFNGDTISTRWNGLVNADKVSLLAYYTYYQYRLDNNITTTSIGDVKGNPENSLVVDDNPKMVFAWNEMVKLYGVAPSVFDYLHYNEEASAYNFLVANKSDYPDWRFSPLKYINRFGL